MVSTREHDWTEQEVSVESSPTIIYQEVSGGGGESQSATSTIKALLELQQTTGEQQHDPLMKNSSETKHVTYCCLKPAELGCQLEGRNSTEYFMWELFLEQFLRTDKLLLKDSYFEIRIKSFKPSHVCNVCERFKLAAQLSMNQTFLSLKSRRRSLITHVIIDELHVCPAGSSSR